MDHKEQELEIKQTLLPQCPHASAFDTKTGCAHCSTAHIKALTHNSSKNLLNLTGTRIFLPCFWRSYISLEDDLHQLLTAVLCHLCLPDLVAAPLTLVDVSHETQSMEICCYSKPDRMSPSGKQMGGTKPVVAWGILRAIGVLYSEIWFPFFTWIRGRKHACVKELLCCEPSLEIVFSYTSIFPCPRAWYIHRVSI